MVIEMGSVTGSVMVVLHCLEMAVTVEAVVYTVQAEYVKRML